MPACGVSQTDAVPRTDAAPGPRCSNGLDDDADGLVDFPNDPGCTSPADDDEVEVRPECADGADNDGDALVDLADLECVNAVDDREAANAACANGLDDDGDALEDWVADPGCVDAEDPSENGVPSCADPPLDLTATGAAAGIFSPADGSSFAGSCGGAGPEALAMVAVPSLLSSLALSVSASGLAAVAHLRGACADAATELGCSTGTGSASLELGSVPPGPVWIFADSDTPLVGGAWSMSVSGVIASGEPCAPADLVFLCDFAAGEACRVPVPGVGPACFPPACSDGYDNDGDAIVDYPYDCGCNDLADADETDVPAVIQCCNGLDDDGDALIDYPADPGCAAAGDGLEL
jgi:hypothetical protein